MEKVEKKFFLNGQTFELMYDKNDIQCYINADSDLALITDKNGNVLFKIDSGCGQDMPYLIFNDKI